MLRPFLVLSILLWSAWSLPDFAAVLAAGLAFMPLAFFWAGCPCCGCNSCNAGTVPDQVQVDMSGFTNSGVCSDCSELDGTYILDLIEGFSLPPSTVVCQWRYEFSPTPTTCNYVAIRFAVNAGSIQVNVMEGLNPATDVLNSYGVMSGASTDCSSYSSTALPHLFDDIADTYCVGSAATVTVTSL